MKPSPSKHNNPKVITFQDSIKSSNNKPTTNGGPHNNGKSNGKYNEEAKKRLREAKDEIHQLNKDDISNEINKKKSKVEKKQDREDITKQRMKLPIYSGMGCELPWSF